MLIKVKQLMEKFVFKANQSNGDVPTSPSAHLNEKSNARRMKNLKNNFRPCTISNRSFCEKNIILDLCSKLEMYNLSWRVILKFH